MTETNDDRTQVITERAYELFLARGGEHGLHEEDWAEAERQLTAEGRIATLANTTLANREDDTQTSAERPA